MNDPAPVPLEVSLGEDETFGRLHVELAAYCDFDAWMDRCTESLVERWRHAAAPASLRSRRSASMVQRS